jgi:surfactin synthase thioesterase subunit
MLPACIQVCPVEIPGRGRRAGEPAIEDLRNLASLLAESLPLRDRPYALFGTCLGAILSYEVAQEVVRTRAAPPPLVLFAAAAAPPHLYAGAVAKLYMRRRLGKLGLRQGDRCAARSGR